MIYVKKWKVIKFSQNVQHMNRDSDVDGEGDSVKRQNLMLNALYSFLKGTVSRDGGLDKALVY
jgi:hypothetical protein